MTLLKVPFHEKDLAKSLGAKWNPDLKSWYVPDMTPLDPFSKWIPLNDTQSDSSAIPLSDLLFMVENKIRSNFSKFYWVKAEIANISDKHHIYLDLVEFSNNFEVAKTRAVIWFDEKKKVTRKFKNNTGDNLSRGMSVLLKVSIDFHSRFGLSLNVVDIDPAHTLGDMQVKVNDIVVNLKKSGIYSNNRNISPPTEFTNVAVIGPENAAGVGDFRVEADILSSKGICDFSYFTAIFQGDSALQSIVDAFNTVNNHHQERRFDAIVFIRGGGSKTDLHFVNEFEIANCICLSNIPVFTGIGHEQDQNVPDLISNLSFDTPSKVILHLQSTIFSNAMKADLNYENIIGHSRNHVHFALNKVSDNYHNITNSSKSTVQNSQFSLRILFDNISALVTNKNLETSAELFSKLSSIYQFFDSELHAEKLNLQHIMKSILQNNPLVIQKEGFAIISKGTEIVSSVDQIKTNDQLTISLKDGTTSATSI